MLQVIDEEDGNGDDFEDAALSDKPLRCGDRVHTVVLVVAVVVPSVVVVVLTVARADVAMVMTMAGGAWGIGRWGLWCWRCGGGYDFKWYSLHTVWIRAAREIQKSGFIRITSNNYWAAVYV